MRGEFTASQQRLAVFVVSQPLRRAATDLRCHLTLGCLFFLSIPEQLAHPSLALPSVPARVWSLCGDGPLLTRHTWGCFLPSIFRFPSWRCDLSPRLFPSLPPTLRRVRHQSLPLFFFPAVKVTVGWNFWTSCCCWMTANYAQTAAPSPVLSQCRGDFHCACSRHILR